MDGTQFDRLAQGLATGLTRRSSLGSFIAGAAVLLGLARGPEAAAKRRVQSEGPCGNGSIKANRCKKHGQCCTGYCDKKGSQGHGRCRCQKVGESCREDRNCCATVGQPMTCQDSVCVTTAPPPVCSADEDVCLPDVTNDANGGCCPTDVACCNSEADCSDGQTCASGCCQDACRTVGKNGVVAAC